MRRSARGPVLLPCRRKHERPSQGWEPAYNVTVIAPTASIGDRPVRVKRVSQPSRILTASPSPAQYRAGTGGGDTRIFGSSDNATRQNTKPRGASMTTNAGAER